ncbi:MAG: hypothetical protein CME19_02605 [Gemmatimonadetes bacterium]|nr:hypothetical protein [Gemmatimonadota bacterium]
MEQDSRREFIKRMAVGTATAALLPSYVAIAEATGSRNPTDVLEWSEF